MNASMLTLAWRIPSVITQKAAMNAFAKLDLKKARLANASVSIPPCSRSCCTVTLWCSMTDRLAGRKWGVRFFLCEEGGGQDKDASHMPSLVVPVKRSTPASYFVRLKKRAKKVIMPVLQAGTQLPHESKLGIVRHCEAE